MTSDNLPMLLNTEQMSELLGRPVRSVRYMNEREQLPAPVGGTRVLLWHRDEILAWNDAGMPKRRAWENMRGMGVAS